MTTATARLPTPTPTAGPKPLTEGKQRIGILIALWSFVVVPFLAVLAAVPVAWGWGLSWIDVAIALVFYLVSGLGITVGFHRYFTHGSFKAKRWLRVTLAVAGSLASRARRSSGSPTTGGTTRSPTGRATRTRRGGTATASGAWPRACSTRTWAGCSTAS